MRAVISISGQQQIVAKGDVLAVDRLSSDQKTVTFKPLLVVDGENVRVGTPNVEKAAVTAEIVEPESKGPKVKVMKFQAKKRVKKLTGHRQAQSLIKIKSISVK